MASLGPWHRISDNVIGRRDAHGVVRVTVTSRFGYTDTPADSSGRVYVARVWPLRGNIAPTRCATLADQEDAKAWVDAAARSWGMVVPPATPEVFRWSRLGPGVMSTWAVGPDGACRLILATRTDERLVWISHHVSGHVLVPGVGESVVSVEALLEALREARLVPFDPPGV